MSRTYHLKLHVVVSSVDGHARCGWEDSVKESKVRQTRVVSTGAVHSHIQDVHHVFTDQWHHQPGDERHASVGKIFSLISNTFLVPLTRQSAYKDLPLTVWL